MVPGNFQGWPNGDQGDYENLLYDVNSNLIKLDGYLPKTPQSYYIGLGYGYAAPHGGAGVITYGHYYTMLWMPWDELFDHNFYTEGAAAWGDPIPFDPQTNIGLLPSDAYAIDNKMDDGLPQTGQVIVYYPTGCTAGGANVNEYDLSNSVTTSPTDEYGCVLAIKASGI
jgi:hypothetical protein